MTLGTNWLNVKRLRVIIMMIIFSLIIAKIALQFRSGWNSTHTFSQPYGIMGFDFIPVFIPIPYGSLSMSLFAVFSFVVSLYFFYVDLMVSLFKSFTIFTLPPFLNRLLAVFGAAIHRSLFSATFLAIGLKAAFYSLICEIFTFTLPFLTLGTLFHLGSKIKTPLRLGGAGV